MSAYLFRAVPQTGQYEVAMAPAHTGMMRFRTNGASIPRLLWPVLGSPFEPRLIEAAAEHDFAYQVGVQRRDADAEFRSKLLDAGVGAARAWLLWAGVRMFGWPYWRRCRFGRGIGG